MIPSPPRKYLALLLMLLGLVVGFPLIRAIGLRVLLDVLLTLVFAAAIRSVFTGGWRVVAMILGLPTLVGLWVAHLTASLPPLVAFHLLATAFFAFTVGVILRDIHRDAGVSADSIYGAFCGYLLAGLAFGHLHTAVELLAPGSFRGDDLAAAVSDDHRHFLLSYFSFLTLTTVGYGDITPGTDTARGLAVVEAIVGQFYIAVLVAELIGKRVSQSLTPPMV